MSRTIRIISQAELARFDEEHQTCNICRENKARVYVLAYVGSNFVEAPKVCRECARELAAATERAEAGADE